MDVVGLVGPCSTANPQLFPINTPVLRFSNDTNLAKDLGTDGYLLDAINGINDQLVDFQVSIQLVIVRTDYGTALDANQKLEQTIANIMGQSTAGTGVWALLKAPMSLYCTPRVIVCPGYTGQLANSLDTLLINAIGVGYIPDQQYQVTFVQGNGETNGANLVLPQAHVVADHQGNINNSEIFIDAWGAYMTVPPLATLPAADGPPIVAAPAGGQFIFNAVPGIGSTIVLNGSTVSFIAATGTPTGNQVRTAADLGTALGNLLTFLSGSADTQISKLTYTVNGGTLTMTNKTAGAAGNAYTLGGTVTGMSISGPHMTGGQDAASPVNATLTATIALGANPVCASLGPVCDVLIGHAIVESAGTSTIGDFNWRDTLNHQRLIGLSGGVKVIDPLSGNVVVKPLAPRIAGLLVGRDFATGFPFHSCANQPVQGIVGPARTIAFSLTDGSTEGQVLLSGNIGIVVRGLVGVETAISSGGFVFVGTDNMGDDQLWQFYMAYLFPTARKHVTFQVCR
jgi:phage tail sheath protein FI